jgi:hypothetical protein
MPIAAKDPKMAAADFHDLATQFCTLVGAPIPPLTPDADGGLAFSASFRDVDITVTHDPADLPDRVTILVFFGQAPEHAELAVLRQLLHANLAMMRSSPCAFGRNPISGDIVLVSTCPLAELSGATLMEGLQALIDAALQWRSDPTQDEFAGLSESDRIPRDMIQRPPGL